MRVLITGSSGHLGEALVRKLRSSDHEIVGLDRQRPISIATRRVGIAEENLAGGFVTKTLSGTLIERFYGACKILV